MSSWRFGTGLLLLSAAATLAGACAGETQRVVTDVFTGAGGGSGCTPCGDACVDTGADANHCGSCGHACPQGETCSDGLCGLPCTGGTTACPDGDGTKCVDTAIDPQHCGACGKACPAGETCTDGTCGLVCSGGTTTCGDACVDTAIDPANCGSCGNACPAGQLCQAGMCVTTCGGGATACGMSCVDLQHDPSHCGKCGNACPVAVNAVSYCLNGMCGSACSKDFGDCNGKPADGCETPLTTVTDCAACGNKCVLPNATPVCFAGACIVATCNAGYGDCDNDQKSCETNLSNDAKNCGKCGNKCAAGEVCTNGKCAQVGCQNGAVELSVSPNGDMKVCDDPTDQTCEQDVEKLCPPNWGLCSYEQFIKRNDGWTYAISSNNVVVAEIYCRGGGGAGHYTLGPYGGSQLGDDVSFNCGYGSSRDSCTSGYGCNEKFVKALCCAPTASCGNGLVDNVEEACDDGNNLENDACLNNCTTRLKGGC